MTPSFLLSLRLSRAYRPIRPFRSCGPESKVSLKTVSCQGALKETERAQNTDFRRKPLIFGDSPLLLEILACGGRRKPEKTTDFRKRPKIVAENGRKPQIGVCHPRSVAFIKLGPISGLKGLKTSGAPSHACTLARSRRNASLMSPSFI